MSLSNDKVQQLLKEHYICAAYNNECTGQAGGSFQHAPEEPAVRTGRGGGGERNSQILLLTPAGEIVNAMAGYVPPRDLAQELEFGVSAFAALMKMPEADRKAALVKSHEEFVRNKTGRGLDDLQTPRNVIVVIASPQERMVQDHRFCMKHPLLPFKEFRIPELVGAAPTFFGTQVIQRGIPPVPKNVPNKDQ